MSVLYPNSLDSSVGTGTAGASLSVGGPSGESHLSCHADISSVLVSLESLVGTNGSNIPAVGTLTTSDSLTGGGSMKGNLTVTLVNDSGSISNYQSYSTQASATQGWNAIPWVVQWAPGLNAPPVSSYATFGTQNAIPFWAFPASAVNGLMFIGQMPYYATVGATLVARVQAMSSTATTGNYVVGAAIEQMTHVESSDNWGTQAKATTTTAGAAFTYTTTSVTIASLDSMVAGAFFRLQIQRVGTDAADTMAGNLNVTMVSLAPV